MKCPYPDCTGDVTPGEQFCGECGRALTWQNGQPLAMSAGAGLPPVGGETRPMGEPPLPAVPPVSSPSTPTQAMYTPPAQQAAYTPPPAYVPPADTQPAYTPAPPPPPVYPAATTAAPARRGANPLLLILGGGAAVILLLCVACFGLGIAGALLANETPTPEAFPTFATDLPTATSRPLGRATATAAEPTVEATLPSDTPVLPDVTPVDTPEGTDPNATATATASDFDIEFTDYTDAAGGAVIVGIIHNKSSERLENVKVVAELLDANGNTVGTGDDILLPLALMEGDQTLPFQVRIESPGEGAERIHVKVHADVFDPTGLHVFTAAQGLSVEGDTLDTGATGPHVTGQVRNGGQKAATLVEVVAVGYDADGKLVDTGSGFVTTDIAAGDTAPFDLLFLRPDVKIDTYHLAVIGQDKP
jgi:hypothetical protein